jgi:hypothetical protein
MGKNTYYKIFRWEHFLESDHVKDRERDEKVKKYHREIDCEDKMW